MLNLYMLIFYCDALVPVPTATFRFLITTLVICLQVLAPSGNSQGAGDPNQCNIQNSAVSAHYGAHF